MSWPIRFLQSARQFFRVSVGLRAARLCCAVWFALTSIGIPSFFVQPDDFESASVSASQCRCSLAKRLSGTCCCGRDAQAKQAKSCCATKKPASRLSKPLASAGCSSKAAKTELSVSRCDCVWGSPERASQIQDFRLPATVTEISPPEITVELAALPVKGFESVLLLPPVPPPKVVL